MVRPDNPQSVYLDSNCLIYAITNQAASEPINEILLRAQTNKLSVVISTSGPSRFLTTPA